MPDRRARGRLPKIVPLPPDIVTAVQAIGTRVEVPTGTYLYRQGDTADRIYCIAEGYAKVTSESSNGHSIVIAFLGPRYTVGLAGMYAPPVYTFNVIAADQLVAYGWTRPGRAADQAALLRRYLDQVVYHYMEVLATRLHTLGGPVGRAAGGGAPGAVGHARPPRRPRHHRGGSPGQLRGSGRALGDDGETVVALRNRQTVARWSAHLVVWGAALWHRQRQSSGIAGSAPTSHADSRQTHAKQCQCCGFWHRSGFKLCDHPQSVQRGHSGGRRIEGTRYAIDCEFRVERNCPAVASSERGPSASCPAWGRRKMGS